MTIAAETAGEEAERERERERETLADRRMNPF